MCSCVLRESHSVFVKSIKQSVPLLLLGCSVAESSKVKLRSNTGGVFGVFWHLGERFQLIWDPCVHFDGFSGE